MFEVLLNDLLFNGSNVLPWVVCLLVQACWLLFARAAIGRVNGGWPLVITWVVLVAGQLLLLLWLRTLMAPLFGPKMFILRMACAGVTSFLIVALLMPRLIRFLVRQKLGDRPDSDHEAYNEMIRHKSSTPTMGGLLIVPAIFVSTFLFADIGFPGPATAPGCMYVRVAFVVMVWLGGLGAWDDWCKLRPPDPTKKTRDGLQSWQKILFQIGLAVIVAIFIYSHGKDSHAMDARNVVVNAAQSFYFPFKADPIWLPQLAYVLITVVVIVGASNAVNLTDGMDGLAGGCMVIVTGVFLLLAWVTGTSAWSKFFHMPWVPGADELTILCAGMIGACIGFLWYNCLPAQVFMGDTGSLPLGGLIGYISVVTRQELMLFIAGGIFVMEAVSVILQGGYFKSTHGKRLFRIAPIHHHFHMLGWAESKVVVRFWLMGVLLAAVAMATLKLR